MMHIATKANEHGNTQLVLSTLEKRYFQRLGFAGDEDAMRATPLDVLSFDSSSVCV